MLAPDKKKFQHEFKFKDNKIFWKIYSHIFHFSSFKNKVLTNIYFIMKFPKLSWPLKMGSKQWFFNFEDMKKGYLLGSITTEIYF